MALRAATFSVCGLVAFVALIWVHLLGPQLANAAETEDEEDEYGVLFTAPGVEETFAYCSGCHSERIVAQQGLTRDGWIEILEWMVEEQGMGEIDEPDLTIVLDYLATHYNEDRPNFPKSN
ncbi:MAG: aldehyde dehydrogenase [Pseudomonadota bacterium]